MSSKNDFKYQLIDILQSLPVCVVNSAKTEYTVRCPYCGDSHNESHGHFAIHIDVDSDDPIMYRCLKCSISGILNQDVLDELQLPVSPEIQDQLRNFNRKIIKKNKYVSESEDYRVPLYQSNLLNNEKLNYHNQRIGSDLTYQDCFQLKMIFDIFEFMKYNKIDNIPGLEYYQLQILHDHYLGWLSTNNNCIIFRRIHDNSSLARYHKIIINPKNLNGNTFYSIPNQIDLLYTNDINIHIAEGIYDIQSIFVNLEKSNLQNSYFYASCGFGSLTILRYLISNGINTGLNVHIYSDNDKTDYDHIQYLFKKSNVSEWIKHIYLHRNQFENEKDYGVCKDKIKDSKRRLK